MYSKTFEKLLQYGFNNSEINLIKSKDINWDIIDYDLCLWDLDGSCRFICKLSKEEIQELLNIYRFESRENSKLDPTEIFQLGEIDDWAGVSPKSDWKKYVDGYVKSAEILSTSIPIDFIEPYLFMCRHSLELMLKTILMLSQELYDLQPDLPGHHDLRKLWTATYPMIKLVEKCDDGEITFIGKFIDQYHTIDENSFSFRYPVSKSNKSIQHEKYLTLFRLSSHKQSFEKVTVIFQKILQSLEMGEMLKRINKWHSEQTFVGDSLTGVPPVNNL